MTVDQQIAGVHFPPDLDPRCVGRRLVAVCLSDLAAVGSSPADAFLAVAAPPGCDLRRLFEGVLEECRRWRLRLAGGDLARSPRLGASLTLIGRRPAASRWTTRAGARTGDRLWLGGSLGESAAGRHLLARGARPEGRGIALPEAFSRPRRVAAAARRAVRRHLLPTPQLELGRWLAARRRAAAIDLSDGLAIDLHRLCRASGRGAVVETARLPLADGLPELASRLDRDPLELALGGGEDYVLLFALPARSRPPARFGARRIGEITAQGRVRLRTEAGSRPLRADGWDHLTR